MKMEMILRKNGQRNLEVVILRMDMRTLMITGKVKVEKRINKEGVKWGKI